MRSGPGRAPTLIIFLPGRGSRRRSDIEADLHLGTIRTGPTRYVPWDDVVAPARASGHQSPGRRDLPGRQRGHRIRAGAFRCDCRSCVAEPVSGSAGDDRYDARPGRSRYMDSENPGAASRRARRRCRSTAHAERLICAPGRSSDRANPLRLRQTSFRSGRRIGVWMPALTCAVSRSSEACCRGNSVVSFLTQDSVPS